MKCKNKNCRKEKVAELGCIVCRLLFDVKTPANVHHLTGLKYRSTGKKASDEHIIPLCYHHHQGTFGIHTLGTKEWERHFGTQEDLLEIVNDYLAISTERT